MTRTTQHERIALRKLIHDGQYFRVLGSGEIYDAGRYSEFKHGAEAVAVAYGFALADLVLDRHPTLLRPGHQWVIGTPGQSILPTGARMVADAFRARIIAERATRHLAIPGDLRVSRQAYRGGYRHLGKAERRAAVTPETFNVDDRKIRGRDVIVLDDTIASGSTLDALETRIGWATPKSVLTVAVVDLLGRDDLENVLNEARVHDLRTLAEMQRGNQWCWNARAARLVLKEKDTAFLQEYLAALGGEKLAQLATAIKGDRYSKMEGYEVNAAIITAVADAPKSARAELTERELRFG